MNIAWRSLAFQWELDVLWRLTRVPGNFPLVVALKINSRCVSLRKLSHNNSLLEAISPMKAIVKVPRLFDNRVPAYDK